jgi:hypothetical protein
MLRPSKWSLSLRSPHQNPLCTFLSPMPYSSWTLYFWMANRKDNRYTLNGSWHSMTSVCSWFLHEGNCDLLGLFPKIWTAVYTHTHTHTHKNYILFISVNIYKAI